MNQKTKLLIMFLVISIVISGCNPKNEKNTNSTNENNSSTGTKEFYTYSANSNQPYWVGSNIKKVDQGYYYISAYLLYFFDTVSNESYVVCSSPDCSHSNETCSAYLGNYGDNGEYGFLTNGLEVSDTYIYVMGYEKSTVTDFYLYRINKDGTNKKKLFYLYSTDKDYYFYPFTMHENW